VQVSYALSLPTDTRYVSVVRRLAVGTLTELRVEPSCIDDVALALTEACANVVQHGGQADAFDVQFSVDGVTCRITVRETGGHFAGPGVEDGAPSLAGEFGGEDLDPLTHGRGIGLMRLLVDQLRYVPDEAGTTVVLVKELALQPGSALALA